MNTYYATVICEMLGQYSLMHKFKTSVLQLVHSVIQHVNLTALSFHRELQLSNYEDLTQDTLFILLDLSIMEIIHNGKVILIFENILYVIT